MVFPVIKKGTIRHCYVVVSAVKLFWPFADFIEEGRLYKLSSRLFLMVRQMRRSLRRVYTICYWQDINLILRYANYSIKPTHPAVALNNPKIFF
jgi:hypothetical protein